MNLGECGLATLQVFLARVDVGLLRERRVIVTCPAPRDMFPPLSNEKIVTKFREVTNGVIDADRRARLEQTVLTLDQQPRLKELSDLLAPPVTSPFTAEDEAVSA